MVTSFCRSVDNGTESDVHPLKYIMLSNQNPDNNLIALKKFMNNLKGHCGHDNMYMFYQIKQKDKRERLYIFPVIKMKLL